MRTRLFGHLFGVVTLCTFLLAGLIAVPQAVGATTNLGNMNLDGYCKHIGYPGGAQLTGSGVWGWSCVYIPGLTQSSFASPDAFTGVCIWQYDRPDAYAVTNDFGNPYSLTCKAPDFLTVTDNASLQWAFEKMLGPYVNAILNYTNLTHSEQQWLFNSIKGNWQCQRNLNEGNVSFSDAWDCLQAISTSFSPIWQPQKVE